MMQDVIATQRARAFAAHTAEKAGKPMVAKQILEGGADQNWRVKLFARFQAEIEAATIERCAERAKCAFDDRPNSRSGHHSEMDWTDGYRDGTRAAEAAIRNLKGQTS